ncbi:helix-turn-helix domain-containing protein [Streptomyces sp. NPDC058603]|uniref:helix-turn-helix domain-containing protein n=1 Tax=Streptomyces sp. NPDC058603 TaxID=3346551 RepID=UPI00364B16A9
MRSEESVRQRFARVVDEAARSAGYDLDIGKGGQAALARDTGLSESAIGRMLKGQTLPAPVHFEAIAKAIKISPLRLLVEGGVISPEVLRPLSETGQSQVRSRPITPSEAAHQLGITDPIGIQMLTTTIEGLKRLQDDKAAGHADDDNGGTAARM